MRFVPKKLVQVFQYIDMRFEDIDMDANLIKLINSTFYFDGELRRKDGKPISKHSYVMVKGIPLNKKKLAWFLQHGVWAKCHL